MSGGEKVPESQVTRLPGAASPPDTPSRSYGEGGDANKDDPKIVLDALQKLAAQEVDRSERFTSRARQAFLFAAGFFAVVQTVSFNGFASDQVGSHERKALLILAIVAASALVSCGFALLVTDARWKTKDLTSDLILDAANDAAESGRPVAVELSGLYATVVDERRATNSRRKVALWVTQILAGLSGLAVLGELIYALNARI